MNFSDLACIISFFDSISTTNECAIEDQITRCTYTIRCRVYAGRTTNPSCDTDNVRVKFIMTDSSAEFLTTGFFGSTNFDSRVRTIEAVNNNWTNLEPFAFKYYYRSTEMIITFNNIKAIKNEAFKNFVNLKYLNLSSNSIDTLQAKAFLLSDAKDSTSLQILDLSNNKLTILNDEFSYIPKLTTLYLQKNNLHVLSDFIFNHLESLTSLNLSFNYLDAINSTLINSKMLINLDISNNQITKLIGYQLNRLLALQVFNASNNSIESVDSNCFNQAFSLSIVDLSFNNITSPIENVMFTVSNKLIFLNLYNNHISYIQRDSFKHNRLNYINLENNNLSGEIIIDTFAGLNNISKLDLSKQNISSIRNGAFSDMNMLLILNLSYNRISEVESYSFSNLSISVLNISYNRLSVLDFFQNGLTNLTELYLSNNNIINIPQYTFKNQILLKVLDISVNKIKYIEPFSLPLKNVQYLNLSGNELTGVIKKDIFSPAKYLRFLDLSNFNITEIDEMAFVDLPVMARLNLSHNQISKIHFNNFNGVDNIYSLDISNNLLSRLQFNSSILSNLKAVYLNNNKLENTSKIFPGVCKLLYLDISHNNIANLTGVGSYIYPNLTVLHLGQNNIETFNNPDTNTLTTLVDLGLSSNRIKSIKLNYFKDLMSLDLRNNSLTQINGSLFKDIDCLQALDLSQNNITELPPGTFQNMKNLKLVNLSSNAISQLRYGSLIGLHKTELLDISRNNLSSVDVDVFHECEKLNTLIIDYNYLKTLDVQTLTSKYLLNLKSLSLGGNPISCKEIILNVRSGRSNLVEVTAIDKVYHEDNVHGIKCGDYSLPTTVSTSLSPEMNDSSHTTSYIVLIWCTVITLILIAVGALVYIKMYRNGEMIAIYPKRFRSSLELQGVDFNRDS